VNVPDRWQRLPWQLRYRTGPRWASELRRRVILATHRHCHVEFRGPVRLGPGFALDISGDGTFIVGKAVDFRRDFVCEISGSGRVTIGDFTTFTYNSVIQCTTSIDVGSGCSLGSVLLADGNHRFRDFDRPMKEQGYDHRPLRIGDGAVVMSNCVVLADIGDRAVVGANSVVTRPVPPYCLAVGAPARVVEYFGPPDLYPADLDLPAR